LIFLGFSVRFDPFFESARELHDRVQIWSGTVIITGLRKGINTASRSSSVTCKNNYNICLPPYFLYYKILVQLLVIS